MSRAYYYLIASLPMLEFGKRPRILYSEFLNRCREHLVPQDMKIIERASIEPPLDTEDKIEILREWKRFDTALRNELVIARATRMGKDPDISLHGPEKKGDIFLAPIVHWAVSEDSLLDAELYLDRIRWEKIEEIAKGHYFDIEYLVKYALHLQILERWENMGREKGKEVLTELVKRGLG